MQSHLPVTLTGHTACTHTHIEAIWVSSQLNLLSLRLTQTRVFLLLNTCEALSLWWRDEDEKTHPLSTFNKVLVLMRSGSWMDGSHRKDFGQDYQTGHKNKVFIWLGLFCNHQTFTNANQIFLALDLLCLRGCVLGEGMSVTRLYLWAPAPVCSHSSAPADKKLPPLTAEPPNAHLAASELVAIVANTVAWC